MDCLTRVGPARVGLKGNRNMNPVIQKLQEVQLRKDLPEFRPGDTVRVNVRLQEGEGEKGKERLQAAGRGGISKKGGPSSPPVTDRPVRVGRRLERLLSR